MMITGKIFLNILLVILLIIFGFGIGVTAKEYYSFKDLENYFLNKENKEKR